MKINIRLVRTVDLNILKQFFDSIIPITTNHNLIRIGGETDGGYLVPDDLDNIEICFSPGVSKTSNFESELADRGIRSFMADYSVDGPTIKNALFHFEKKYLGTTNNGTYMTLDNWVNRNAQNQNDLILQMDIEGSEYGVILDTSNETLRKFRILVIEFHWLDSLFEKKCFGLINSVFQRLLRNFEIVHIHPNNTSKPIKYGDFEIPPVLEITFLRKDRISSSTKTLNFPHKLDRTSIPRKKDFPTPSCWYQ
jgi:hypothetical protein